MRGLVVVLGLAAFGIVSYLAQLPPQLRKEPMAAIEHILITMPFLVIFVVVLILAILTIFMPWFAYVAAREATHARQAAERIEALLEAQQRVEAAKAWQARPAQVEDAERTIYPVKSPPKVTRMR